MKEIKIMGRADFAGDVALWIFFISCIYIYIYILFRILYIYTYVFIIITLSLWASFRLFASFHEWGTVGRLYLRIVRDASPGAFLSGFSRR